VGLIGGALDVISRRCLLGGTVADREILTRTTGDMMGRMMGEYFLPLLGHFGFKDYLKHAPDVPDSDVLR
jgi:hypothetical protein